MFTQPILTTFTFHMVHLLSPSHVSAFLWICLPLYRVLAKALCVELAFPFLILTSPTQCPIDTILKVVESAAFLALLTRYLHVVLIRQKTIKSNIVFCIVLRPYMQCLKRIFCANTYPFQSSIKILACSIRLMIHYLDHSRWMRSRVIVSLVNVLLILSGASASSGYSDNELRTANVRARSF